MATKARSDVITLIRVNDGAKGDPGKIGDSVSSITEEYYLSTSNTSQTGGSWSTTPPVYVAGKYYWTRSHVVYKKADGSTYSGYTTPVLANGLNSANSEAKNATTIANGKNKVTYSESSNPSATSGYIAGDIWFNKSTGGIWQFNGSKWNLHQVGTTSLANGAVTADKVAANAINAQKINVDALSAISANLGSITAGDINGVTITGSEFVTHWKMYDSSDGIGRFSRVRISGDDFFFDKYESENTTPTVSTTPTQSFKFYFGNKDRGDVDYGDGLWLEEASENGAGEMWRVLLDPHDGVDSGVSIHSGSGSVAFNSGDSATPTKILNKNNFGEPINSIAIGTEPSHTISFGWTGSRLRPVIDGNQIYMPVIDTIFDKPGNPINATADLTSPATNYDALDIFCRTDDGTEIYTKVSNPTVGKTFEVSVNHIAAGGGHMWIKSKQFYFETASRIATGHSGSSYYTGSVHIASNSTPGAVSQSDNITIIKVVGWKY